MPLHHSPSTAQSTVLNNHRPFYHIGFEDLRLYLIRFFTFLHSYRNRTKHRRHASKCVLFCGNFFHIWIMERCIYLSVYSCLLAFWCVSLSVRQSGSSDLGHRTERQLLTTRVDQSGHGGVPPPHGSVSMEWACRGQTSRHSRDTEAWRRWGLGKRPVSLAWSDHTLPKQWLIAVVWFLVYF